MKLTGNTLKAADGLEICNGAHTLIYDWPKGYELNLMSTNINTLTIKYHGISLYSGHLPSWQEKIVKEKFHNTV